MNPIMGIDPEESGTFFTFLACVGCGILIQKEVFADGTTCSASRQNPLAAQ